jgi:NTE family protein
MDSSSRTIDFLAEVPAFAALEPAELQLLYGFTTLRVLAKGELATAAGANMDELRIVVFGRVGELGGGARAAEFGQRQALEAEAFFTRRPASVTLAAMRETLLLALSRDDLAAAFEAQPGLLASVFAGLGRRGASSRMPTRKPARVAVCPAGARGKLDEGAKAALTTALERLAEVRVLRRESFGSLALDMPDTAHWLQEQELEFDLTLVIADPSDENFAKAAIEEADEILFIAGSGGPALSAIENHALERRGKARCRLIVAKTEGGRAKAAAEWLAARPYRSTQWTDLDDPDAAALAACALLGKGNAIAATSCGVHAAAILGALQAFEASGAPPAALAAAGSAILPAGLLACGASLGETEAAFRDLATAQTWKRSARAEAGLYEAGPVDTALGSVLQVLDIGLAARAFAAITRSLSKGAAETHARGRLFGAVRAGLAPTGVLPPFVTEDGDILVGGEDEIEALIAASDRLSACAPILLYPKTPPLGASDTSYRQLSGGGSFLMAAFQGAPDKRVRLETVLGAPRKDFGAIAARLGALPLGIPIAEGVGPMDWGEWARLRDDAFDWTVAEIEARRLAQM